MKIPWMELPAHQTLKKKNMNGFGDIAIESIRNKTKYEKRL